MEGVILMSSVDKTIQDMIKNPENDALDIIIPADEKTHGFNRVDDSPQIF